MVLWVLRTVFLLVIISLTFFVIQSSEIGAQTGWGWKLDALMYIPVFVGVLMMAADIFWRKKNLQALSGLFFGVLGGLVIAYVLGLVVEMVSSIFQVPPGSPLVQLIRLQIGAIVVFLSVSFVLQTKDDFRFIIPYVEFARESKGSRPLLLDTSVIIDGRVADLAEARVFESPLVIPKFVLGELHTVADSADKLRRNRGRRGLDILRRMQGSSIIEVQILDSRAREVEEAGDVDNKLVALARNLNGRIMTTDYNLNKVAQLRGVDVVNLNDIANAMKTVALPGEPLRVRIVKPGEEPNQGVGYLEDGTMVVAEHGREAVGQEVTLIVTSSLQTSAGRMIFGKLEDRAKGK